MSPADSFGTAIGVGIGIGVDIERVRPPPDVHHWHHVAQTTQEEDVSRRDAKAQRRREVHLEHRATRCLAISAKAQPQ
ncbi:MAG: hypothetical protein N838_25610 [Thiohalocapsa sp. PB-PSB1]|nr:MAG: hypothetical protein N838_25610 [Thiohalocapsa sp. PB-PSB1]